MLLGFVAFFSMTRGWSAAHRRLIPAWITGLLFGVMAVVAMLVPTVTGPGVIFDCRSGVIGTGALMCGPVCALTSLPLPCLYRLYVGGPGAIPGLLEIVLPAILGALCHMVLRVHRMDLGKCVQGIERMLRETLGPRIQMCIETESSVGRMDLDPDRIEQAVVHLAINASEAMSGAGELRITVRRADLSEAERRRLEATAGERGFHNGPFALLAVQDTGCGMSEEVASRLFEPSFTTKANRENAGLSLATVYNIIRAHNGYIEVETQLGRGTTFLIYMPVKEAPQAA